MQRFGIQRATQGVWAAMVSSSSMVLLGLLALPALGQDALPAPKPVAAGPGADKPGQVELIPRTTLFGNPDKASARISPDGTRIAFLAPVDGVLNVWVGPISDPEAAKPVTDDKKRGIRSYFWAFTNDHIIYLQDVGGDEDWHVYATNLKSNKTIDLTPLENVAAQIQEVSNLHPGEILVGLNDRNPQLHDIYRVDIETGTRTLVQENPGFMGFLTDDQYRVRMGTRFSPDGSTEVLEPDDKGGWKVYTKIPQEDSLTTSPVGFDKTGRILYWLDSRGRDTAALRSTNLDTGDNEIVAANDKADVGGVLTHPTERTIEAVSFTYTRREWDILDPKIKKDFEFLKTVADGELQVTSRSLDDNHWVVAYIMDDGPVRYYYYDRAAADTKFLFTNRTDLEGLPLATMHAEVIEARDGLNLVSYLTLPLGSDKDGNARPESPLPMVLSVHGGPWSRDSWGFSSSDQLLANRGYAVLSVNFRGSTGFGKGFLNAGNKEWAGKMHDDLIDAVNWAVEEGIAQKDKIAIMGGSYGGYATLVGLTVTPKEFACGVDIVGPSNILTLLSTIPAYWQPAIQMFKDRVGDFTTEEGKEFLRKRSPLTYVDRIERPLLIGQGANDPRVKQAEADQIVSAMQERKIPVTYVLFPDEGHGFARPENNLAFFAVTEAFLAEHLGGRYEPIGDDFAGASISVPSGVAQVPGLKQAIDQKAQSTAQKD